MTASAKYWIDNWASSLTPRVGTIARLIARASPSPRKPCPHSSQVAAGFDRNLFLAGRGELLRLPSSPRDELWHFYAGAPFVVHVIEEDGRYSEISLGSNPDAGERLQAWSRRAAGCLARQGP